MVVSKCENMDIEQNPGSSNHIELQKMHLYYCKEVSIKEMKYLVLIQEGVNAYNVV